MTVRTMNISILLYSIDLERSWTSRQVRNICNSQSTSLHPPHNDLVVKEETDTTRLKLSPKKTGKRKRIYYGSPENLDLR